MAIQIPEEERLSAAPRVRRAAMLVVHSNPLREPGVGDAGGMTVYVRQVARSLAARGIQVDIFTRRDSYDASEIFEIYPGVRVVQIDAGDPSLTKEEVPSHLPEFAANLQRFVDREDICYDLIHSHYWLSGRVAALLRARWGVPFVHTFHTLGRVKNGRLRYGDREEPEARLHGEAKVIAEADAIVASTGEERDWLVDLYAAHPERIHLIHPGVDHRTFKPGDRAAAKKTLGVGSKKVLLFVGRLQPLKAPDTAIRALAHILSEHPSFSGEIELLVVGGPSGSSGRDEVNLLRDLARQLGVDASVRFVPPQPHSQLPAYYQAADVCLVPSHSESFGLVALEAQACGVPVVGSEIGGLKSIVHSGKTGFLVEPGSSRAFAESAIEILSDETLALKMSRCAVMASSEFSWDRSAAELHEIYKGTAAEEETSAAAPCP